MKASGFWIVMIAAFITALDGAAQGYLHAEDQAIVDGDGNNVILRGMGLGGWMLQEGYMLQTAGFANAQHKIEETISELIGEEATTLFYQAWRDNHVRETDIDSLKSWGFNSVRLPMHYNLYTLPIEDEPVMGEHTWLEEGFRLTDSLLAWCAEREMYVILDLHAAPGGQGKDEGISDYDTDKPSLWESSANRDKTVALWRRLAERYANEPWIGGYDLLNEVNWPLENNEALLDIYHRLTDTIRAVDNNHILFIEGNWFANDFTNLTPPWDNNLVYSPHKYWSINDQASIQWVLDIREEHNVPLYFGESGENSNLWFRDAIKLIEDNNIGWAWWPMKKVESIAGPLSVNKTEGYQALLDYWNDGGSPPDAEDARETLMELTDLLRIENCNYQKDVIDAMFRQVESDETLPFARHKIPGVIYASDFDLGSAGQAYDDSQDANYQVSTGAFTAWNNGWTLRNDGVDIERSPDFSNTNGYNIGWTVADEWIKYSADIIEGAYDVKVYVASEQDGGRFHLSSGESDVSSSVDVSNTGGWQSWMSTTLSDIAFFDEDDHFKMYIDQAEFNVARYEFLRTGPTTDIITEYLSSSTLDDKTIQVTLNKPLEANADLSDILILINGIAVDPDQIIIDPENPRRVLITVIETIRASDEIVSSYTGSLIKAIDGTFLNKFNNKIVQNKVAIINAIPGQVEAEDYFEQSGIQLENTNDTGGGENIGFLDQGDFLDYYIDVKERGLYTVEYRTAALSEQGAVELALLKDGEKTILDKTSFPSTGDWQNWTTTNSQVWLPAGRHQLRVTITASLFNMNWMNFSKKEAIVHALPGKIEAEDYFEQNGVELENTTDAGGGKNIGFLDTGDFLDYFINVDQSGIYEVEYRTAALEEIGAITLSLIEDGEVNLIDSISFEPTGDWQSWRSTNSQVRLPAGRHHLRMEIAAPLFNVNWMKFSVLTATNDPISTELISISPNPGLGLYQLTSLELPRDVYILDVISSSGALVLHKLFSETQLVNERIDLTNLSSGTYNIRIQGRNGLVWTEKLVKVDR